MNWILKNRLRRFSKRANPDHAFVRHLQQELRGSLPTSVFLVQPWKIALSSLSILTLIGSGTGVYAYSSDEVLPDHPLYAVRQGLERVEETIAPSAELKVDVQVKHLKRRLHEQEILAARHKDITQDTVVVFDTAIQKLMDDSVDLPADVVAQIDLAIEQVEQGHERVLVKEQEQATSIKMKEQLRIRLEQRREQIQLKIDALALRRKERIQQVQDRKIEKQHKDEKRLDTREKKQEHQDESNENQIEVQAATQAELKSGVHNLIQATSSIEQKTMVKPPDVFKQKILLRH